MVSRHSGTEESTPATRTAQSADLRRQNVASIMRTILAHDSLSRADIARLTNLAPGSVTKLTSMLVQSGVCHELPVSDADRQPGRPPVPMIIERDVYRMIGVHIGLLRTTIGIVDLTGKLVDEIVLPHHDTSFSEIVKQAVRRIRALTTRRSRTRVIGIGATAGGIVDPDSGVVVEHPALGWRQAPLRDALSERLGLPVHVDNTVRALALTECWFGAGADVGNLLLVFAGNIVGAAMVFDRSPHRGRKAAAGYIDHLPIGVRTGRRCECGRSNCLQAVASDMALTSEARRLGLLTPKQELDDLVALARDDDARAATLLRTRARHVGAATALLVEILDPDRVVVAGGVVDDPAYLPEIQDSVASHVHMPLDADPKDFVRATSFGRHAVALSSATLCLDAYYRDPMAHPPLTT